MKKAPEGVIGEYIDPQQTLDILTVTINVVNLSLRLQVPVEVTAVQYDTRKRGQATFPVVEFWKMRVDYRGADDRAEKLLSPLSLEYLGEHVVERRYLHESPMLIIFLQLSRPVLITKKGLVSLPAHRRCCDSM